MGAHYDSLVECFGATSVEQLQHLLKATAVEYGGSDHGSSFLEGVLPVGGSSVLAAVLVHHDSGSQALQAYNSDSSPPAGSLLRGNLHATLKALRLRKSASTEEGGWTSEAASGFGERLLQVPEAAFKLVTAPGSSDYAAMRYLAEAVRKNMSAKELAGALQEDAEGRRCLQAFHTSPTLGAVVGLASWWWDDVLEWLEGAVQWVKDAASAFGEWATKTAKAVVDNVFSRYEWATEVLESIPVIGLGVAAIYYISGDKDHAIAALAINLNSTLTIVASSIGFVLGGPAGAMAGGALGKAAGLLLQMWMSRFIDDPKLRAEVGDISLTRFLIDVFLAGAAYGGATGIAKTLGTELGYGFLKKLAMSATLAVFLAELPLSLT